MFHVEHGEFLNVYTEYFQIYKTLKYHHSLTSLALKPIREKKFATKSTSG